MAFETLLIISRLKLQLKVGMQGRGRNKEENAFDYLQPPF